MRERSRLFSEKRNADAFGLALAIDLSSTGGRSTAAVESRITPLGWLQWLAAGRDSRLHILREVGIDSRAAV